MYVNMSLVEFKHSVLIGSMILSIEACSAVDLNPGLQEPGRETKRGKTCNKVSHVYKNGALYSLLCETWQCN